MSSLINNGQILKIYKYFCPTPPDKTLNAAPLALTLLPPLFSPPILKYHLVIVTPTPHSDIHTSIAVEEDSKQAHSHQKTIGSRSGHLLSPSSLLIIN